MRKSALLLMLWTLGMSSLPAHAVSSSCSASSGDFTVALLELYTSEGCSSCPPADNWLATLTARGLVPERVVPLALHVDYWNDLGWEDPYSQKTFARRQYRLAGLVGARTVYTPQFILNGRDLPRWRSKAEAAIRKINAARPRADIELKLSRNARRIGVTADSRTKDNGSQTETYIALYESNLVSRIPAGENQGLTLRHDFVVRRLLGPMTPNEKGVVHVTRDIELEEAWKETDMGVAAFVQDRDSGEVWQALALPLCR